MSWSYDDDERGKCTTLTSEPISKEYNGNLYKDVNMFLKTSPKHFNELKWVEYEYNYAHTNEEPEPILNDEKESKKDIEYNENLIKDDKNYAYL